MPTNREYRRLPMRQHITEIKFTGRQFSRARIVQEVERIRERIPNKKFQVLLPYETWKPGSMFEDGEDISLFSLLDIYDESEIPEGGGDPPSFDRFIVYMMNPSALTGGCDPKRDNGLNDCLYQCLYYAYGTFSRMPKNIERPEILKEALGLQRADPVPVSYIDKVERIAKTIAINITGDVDRISKSSAYRKITLTLANGHYSLVPNPERKQIPLADKKPKRPIIYQKDGVNNLVKTYDGKSIRSTTIPEFGKLKSRLYGKCCFIPVEKDRKTAIYETLEESYTRIHEERDVLLQESKKLGSSIDLFMCNGSYKQSALWLFERLSQAIPANEVLDPIEAKWISEAMMGGLIWADNDWQGYGRQYDETSLYPSIQQSALTFPIGRGEFQTLKDFVNRRGYILYGIFHATVEKKQGIKLFRYNKHNRYTHIDLTRAKALGLQVNLIQDGTPNSLVYEKKTRIPGKVIFGEYVEFLFNLKNLGGIVSRVAKRILNTLWGALCQRKRFYYDISDAEQSSHPFDHPEGKVLQSIIPIGDSRWKLQYCNPGNLFKGEYPRIAPFLLAQGRKIISETINPVQSQVRRVHTDGFILEEDEMKSSPLIECEKDAPKILGALKFEKEGKCYVKNANQVSWL